MTLLPDADAAAGEERGRVPSPSSAATPAAPAEPLDVPTRASGLELIGEVAGSGYREPPALVRRADGQTIQLTPLLYLVLEAVDGRRDLAGVAEAVSASSGRLVTSENVATLCGKLRELGTLQRADGTDPELKRSNPLLGLRFRYVVSDEDVTRRLTAPFAALFAPVVVVVVLLAFLAVCGWVLAEKGLASAAHDAFHEPGLLLAVFGLTILSAGFHEFGHAAAARYGGARPGAMGAGLYLVWPAFYTDVTDSYRLGRGGRVRTDLGGLYFNAIVAVAMFGLWFGTRWDAVLLIIATQVLQMLRQLAPFVRFDGYHVLADLTGVPDLYHRIGPTLASLLPGRWRSPEARVLKPWARAVVTTWVLVVVPVLLVTVGLMVLALPRLVATAVAGVTEQGSLLGERWSDGDVLGASARALGVAAIALPVMASLLLLVRTTRQVATRAWRGTDGRPVRRAGAGALAALLVAGLAWAWWPQPGIYRPIQAYERGALQDALPALTRTMPVGLSEGRAGRATTLWPEGEAVPTAARPALSVVMVPRGGATTAPTWVFPFNRPLPPDEGDNQALSVNTTDGSTQYDVALALVWADGDRVLNTNEAYAFASCTGCRTVAVAFQVVLISGQADVVVPQNLSGAVNYACVECLTFALATQLVVTVPGELDAAARARLEEVWGRIAAFGAGIEGVPLSEIQGRLEAFETEILEVVGVSPTGPGGTVPSGSPTGSPAPGGTTGPDPGASPADPPPSGEPAPSSPAPDPEPSAGPSAEPSPEPSAEPSVVTSPEPGSGAEPTATP
ncbi:hypothetical protein [Oryzobacter telluris]|uniref:hypothetical protein n=1 Tax=Oryzobacter telluris TaxID=3149179 RepID=UPI00370D69A4